MEKITIEDNWNEISGRFKQKYADLANEDFQFVENKEEELLGKLKKKLGQTKENIRDYINKI